MISWMDTFAPAEAPAAPPLRDRDDDSRPVQVEPHAHLSRLWTRGNARTTSSTRRLPRTRRCRARSRRADGARLLAAYKLSDEIGQLSYKVWYFVALRYDEDQRDNEINARRQQVQILFAKVAQASAWFRPRAAAASRCRRCRSGWPTNAELARLPLCDRRSLSAAGARARRQGRASAVALEPLFVDAERRVRGAVDRRRQAPDGPLSNGTEVTLTYGQYRAILATNRNQADRAAAFTEYHKLYEANVNTYASLYNGVLQRDWFHAQARGYRTTLDAALHGNNIPTTVVENLIETTKAGHRAAPAVSPAAQARARASTRITPTTRRFRSSMSIEKYPYDDVLEWLPASVAPLGADYQRQLREALNGGWIDVYENPGKRSGAYSAPVYGVHPYMLLNYNDTLDAVFTLAHEVGHSMHTLLSHAHQPFVYAGLHDLRRRSALDAERSAVPRVHARRRPPTSASGSCCCSTPSTASSAPSTRR